jgi:hypothetical protein
MTKLVKGITAMLLLTGGILLSAPSIKAACCSGGGSTCCGCKCEADDTGCSAGPCVQIAPES